MSSMDIFNQDAFSAVSMTRRVNDMDYVPGTIGELGIFEDEPINTTSVAIEKRGTELSLISTSERGAPPSQSIDDKRTIRDLRVPHLSKEAVVYADQVQSVRAFGSESELETVQSVVDRKLGKVNSEHDMTLENLRLGAVKGIILDADGTTPIYNLFTEFGVSQLAEFDFEMDDAGTDVRGKLQQLYRLMAVQIKMGNIRFSIHAACGAEFFDNLVGHASVKEAYDRWMAGQHLRENYAFGTFRWGNFVFHDYRGSDDGSVGVEAAKAHFFPVGVPGLFRNAWAPADTMDFVNTMGLPRYVIPGRDPSGRDKFVSFEVQANPLPYCTKPKSLIKAKKF